MVKQWGFVHLPLGAGTERRAEILIGYPFAFATHEVSSFGIACRTVLGTAIFLSQTARGATFLINGVDRSAWVGIGIKRSQQTSAGSVSTLNFALNNGHGRAHYKPEEGDEIIVYVLDESSTPQRFFAGYVRTVREKIRSGTSGLIEGQVTCGDYGSILQRRIVGRHYELLEGGIATVTLINMLDEFVPEISLAPSYPASVNLVNLGLQDFNYVPASDAISQIAAKANFSYRVDYNKLLQLFTADEGYASAPYTLTPGDGNFLIDPEFTTSESGRANRVGVKNSRDMVPIWTDEFVADGTTTLFGPVNAAFAVKPSVSVAGVLIPESAVTEFGNWVLGWQVAYSINDRVLQFNPANAAPVGVIEVKYPSRLSYIAWAPDGTEDAVLREAAQADQALRGKFEIVVEVKDLADIDAMQAAADGLLARYLPDPVDLNFQSDKFGWEAGQLVTSNLPGYEGDYLIESVDSEEQGKGRFFRHTIRATNSPQRSASGIRAMGALIASGRQAVDRITFSIGFTLAETIDGLTNPGLTTGPHPSNQGVAKKDGTVRDVTVFFESAVSSPVVLTETDCTFDIYDPDGVSIFGTQKLTWPAGATSVQTRFLFASNPLTVNRGDRYTLDVLTADSRAKDGIIEMTVLG